jgi:hypothetical protein
VVFKKKAGAYLSDHTLLLCGFHHTTTPQQRKQ